MSEQQILILEAVFAFVLGILSDSFSIYLIHKYREDKTWEFTRSFLYVCIMFVSIFVILFEIVWIFKIIGLPV